MSPAPGELPADLVAEGARYAAALLDRIARFIATASAGQ